MPVAQRGGTAPSGATVILDNGGGTVKVGLSTDAAPRVVEPNCTAVPRGQSRRLAAKPLAVGAEVLDLPAYDVYRPTQRGLLLDADQQQAIWDTIFTRRFPVDPKECSVLVTEAPLTPPSIRKDMLEVLFDCFGFREVAVLPGPDLAVHSPGLKGLLGAGNPCCTVLDMGFSSCLAMPCVGGCALPKAARRLNLGGRALTNLMLQRIRLRHVDLSDSWLIAEDLLAQMCEVSLDFDASQRGSYADVAPKTFVLPDFQQHKRGFVEQGGGQPAEPASGAAPSPQQRVTLAAERVAVPEALFNPKDQGVNSGGVAQVVRQAIAAVPEESWQPHLGQVVLCGGLAKLPGLKARLHRELRMLLPTHYPLKIVAEQEPEFTTWRGAAHLAQNREFRAHYFKDRRGWSETGAIAPSNKRKACD